MPSLFVAVQRWPSQRATVPYAPTAQTSVGGTGH